MAYAFTSQSEWQLPSDTAMAADPLIDAVAIARETGRLLGGFPDCHAGMCPWTNMSDRELRWSWLDGFARGRAARGKS